MVSHNEEHLIFESLNFDRSRACFILRQLLDAVVHEYKTSRDAVSFVTDCLRCYSEQ